MSAAILLALCAAASAVQVPPASSYVYRSDGGAPATLLSLGPLFAAPAPLPYVNARPIVVEDAEEDAENGYVDDGDDDDDAGVVGGEGLIGGEGLVAHGHESGGGSGHDERYHNAHGEKGSKGYSSEGHHAKGLAGSYGRAHDQGYYHQSKGEKGAHHDEADAHGAHHQAGKSYKGGDHGHKKHHSKGEDVSGYHKVFSKDEYKKDHDFYDEAAKDGRFHKHGYQKAHHAAGEGAHAKGGSGAKGFEQEGYGKAGYHTKGEVDEADAGHSAEEGADEHYSQHEEYGKKGARDHGRQYEYAAGDDE